jgi:hypothetical protein
MVTFKLLGFLLDCISSNLNHIDRNQMEALMSLVDLEDFNLTRPNFRRKQSVQALWGIKN